ncbi:MAG: hypothetical protein KOO66_08640 [Bacteroidales bacterium]|nr:hypothetical protein [Bacteroidales bacterium]
MKSVIFSLFLILTSLSGISQKLNKLGKIDLDVIPSMPDHRIEKNDGVYKVIKDSFVFEGNTYYSVPDGFITSLEIVDDKKDYIKHYSSDGKLIATILTDRIINLKISESGNNMAFYNTENIIHINMSNYKIDTLKGSFVYSFVGNGELIYYNSEDKHICYKENRIFSDEYPNQFIEYKGKVFVVTKQRIYELKGNSLFPVHEFKGSFFDAKIIDDEFYFVDKLEKRKTESFTLYKTSDFVRILMIDKLDELNR